MTILPAMRFLHRHFTESGDDGLPAMNRRSLRFLDPVWDERFRAAYRAGNLVQVRNALWIAAVLNTLFVPLDLTFFPENNEIAALVRAVVVNGLFIGMGALSYATFFHTRWPALLLVSAIGYTLFQAIVNITCGLPQPVDSGFVLVIFAIYALFPFFYSQAVDTAWICSVLFVGITGYFGITDENLSQSLANIFLIVAANVIGLFALRRIELLRRRDFARGVMIDEERERARQLLDRILPRSVAERLRQGETRLVERLGEVTVLFADIEGFTTMAANVPPEEALGLLSRTFGRFDELVVTYGVEKIKTIGDAYMVAAGAPPGSGCDIDRVAALALAMMEAVRDDIDPQGHPFRIRIGIAHGPLIAGVVGESRFLYDLWGDTVNLASRLEATGEGGRIQVSAEVARALEGRFRLEPRGEIDIKGKGRLPTWWLLGPAEQAAGDGTDKVAV
ncbi:MAG: adenylate/guanylate cyclase domain-containing protein [Pseudomonadota bacterium]|nr:adenylate/guanylate cyclase domain-containing protein [Pseudomonadota bacterium]